MESFKQTFAVIPPSRLNMFETPRNQQNSKRQIKTAVTKGYVISSLRNMHKLNQSLKPYLNIQQDKIYQSRLNAPLLNNTQNQSICSTRIQADIVDLQNILNSLYLEEKQLQKQKEANQRQFGQLLQSLRRESSEIREKENMLRLHIAELNLAIRQSQQ